MSHPVNPADLAEQAIRRASTGAAQEREQAHRRAADVFRVLHGMYGVAFTSKWASGVTTPAGGDAGVESARAIWAHGLRGFSDDAVKDALRDCLTLHPEFAPSLPQFVALCEAVKPREVFKALPMSAELYADRSKEAREKLRQLRERIQPVARASGGLALLFEAIADAVKCAGGDEIAALRRLDVMLAARGGA